MTGSTFENVLRLSRHPVLVVRHAGLEGEYYRTR
jgi:hypothetical protein